MAFFLAQNSIIIDLLGIINVEIEGLYYLLTRGIS